MNAKMVLESLLDFADNPSRGPADIRAGIEFAALLIAKAPPAVGSGPDDLAIDFVDHRHNETGLPYLTNGMVRQILMLAKMSRDQDRSLKIEAIKWLRGEAKGLGLREAKVAVEDIANW